MQSYVSARERARLIEVLLAAQIARQDEQWQDLERRRNVPQPKADALR